MRNHLGNLDDGQAHGDAGRQSSHVLRRQIPLVQAYAMTINKAQGMTLDKVLFDARRAPFQHGHAYVLFSRVRNRASIGAVVDDATRQRSRGGGWHLVTTTVLYDELLRDDAPLPGGEPSAAADSDMDMGGGNDPSDEDGDAGDDGDECDECADGGGESADEAMRSGGPSDDDGSDADSRDGCEFGGACPCACRAAPAARARGVPLAAALFERERAARHEYTRLWRLQRDGIGPSDIEAQCKAAEARARAASLAVHEARWSH